MFGPNARLDIGGSFTASTAERLLFRDGGEFSAAPGENELLSISVPLGVQFNDARNSDTQQGDISSFGILKAERDLTLSGNHLYLEGQVVAGEDLTLQAEETVTIRDTVTDAFLARSGEDLTIQGDRGIDIWTLQHLEQTPFVSGGNLNLISDGLISGDAHFVSGGNLQLLNLSGAPGTFVSYYDPIISADGDVVFGDYEGVALKVRATGSIQAGHIVITGPDETFDENSPRIDEARLGGSRAAILRAGRSSDPDAVELPQEIGGTNFTSGSVVGQPPGSIVVKSINTSNDVSNVDDDTIDRDGGPIILSARGNGNITVTESFTGPENRNGNTQEIALGSFSYSNSEGVDVGNGGLISVSTEDGKIEFRGGGALNSSSSSLSGDSGQGGDISLSTRSGDITLIRARLNSSSISSSTSNSDIENSGWGGDITLSTVSGNIEVRGSRLNSTSFSDSDTVLEEGDSGRGGDITLSTDSTSSRRGTRSNIRLENSRLESYTNSSYERSGRGGDISLSIRSPISNITLDNSHLNSSSVSTSSNSGRGGDIFLSSKNTSIIVLDSTLSTTLIPPLPNAEVSKRVDSIIEIIADNVFLSNSEIRASISDSSVSNASGKIIFDVSNELELSNDSLILSQSINDAIEINASTLIAEENNNSDIIAEFGNVEISDLFASEFNTASNFSPERLRNNLTNDIGSRNEITLLSPEIDQRNLELSTQPDIPEPLQTCQTPGGEPTGSFINSGSGGLPPNPTEPLRNSAIWEDVRPPSDQSSLPDESSEQSSNPENSPPSHPAVASGWVVNDRGDVELVATMPSNLSQRDCPLTQSPSSSSSESNNGHNPRDP